MYKEMKQCIVCGGALTQVLDLGDQYVVDFVKEKNEDLLRAPLILMNCNDCSLLQLKHKVDPDRLYKKFWYRSGINEQMRNELLAIVQKASEVVEMKPGDKVLDIGCNDGTLLGWYDKRVMTFGVDPATALVKEGMEKHKIDVGIADYFSEAVINGVCKKLGVKGLKFKIITAVAMFYDLDNPVQFLKDCKNVLDKEGVLVVQMNYIGNMLKDDAFDFICHEHLALYSVTTFKVALEKAGLDLQGIEMSQSNGGSIRAYVTHPGFDKFGISKHSNKLWMYTNANRRIMEEMNMGLSNQLTYKGFEARVMDKMLKLRHYLEDRQTEGKEVYVYGASTRGTVLLQYLYPDEECTLKGVAETDENKFGLKMVGSWLPIMSEDLVRSKATHMLVLPWHFQESIVKKERDWITQGGTLIFPLPNPHLAQPFENADMPINTGVGI